MPHAEMAQRVYHRIYNGRRASDGTGLANAFDAQGIYGRWCHGMAAFDPGHHRSFRHRVIHELSGDELSIVVVNGLFIERLAYALCNAAVDLTVHQQRIDN